MSVAIARAIAQVADIGVEILVAPIDQDLTDLRAAKQVLLAGCAQQMQQWLPKLAETPGKDVVEEPLVEECDPNPLANQNMGGDQTLEVGVSRRQQAARHRERLAVVHDVAELRKQGLEGVRIGKRRPQIDALAQPIGVVEILGGREGQALAGLPGDDPRQQGKV
jgi:hypothetical protein